MIYRFTPSLINLLFKYVWFEDIGEGSAIFRCSAKTFETNFVSVLRNEIGFQFLTSSLYMSFFQLIWQLLVFEKYLILLL